MIALEEKLSWPLEEETPVAACGGDSAGSLRVSQPVAHQ